MARLIKNIGDTLDTKKSLPNRLRQGTQGETRKRLLESISRFALAGKDKAV